MGGRSWVVGRAEAREPWRSVWDSDVLAVVLPAWSCFPYNPVRCRGERDCWKGCCHRLGWPSYQPEAGVAGKDMACLSCAQKSRVKRSRSALLSTARHHEHVRGEGVEKWCFLNVCKKIRNLVVKCPRKLYRWLSIGIIGCVAYSLCFGFFFKWTVVSRWQLACRIARKSYFLSEYLLLG